MPKGYDLVSSSNGQLAFIGSKSIGGTYVLELRVNREQRMAFGGFKGGKLITVEPGWYAYVGSALGVKGPSCLARRLVRHATRLGSNPPHPIRNMMLTEFHRVGLGSGDLCPRNGKKPRWNIDHPLDLPDVDLLGASLIRSPLRIEAEVGKLLENDPFTVVFERGLGANDIPGNTHLLRVDADERWWDELPGRLYRFLRSFH